MSQPPEDPITTTTTHSTGAPDRQTLRLLERNLSSDSLIAETAFDPDSYERRLLRGLLEAGRYPDTVTTVRLDIRWFTTGDFSVPYVEEHEDVERWECRWYRHPNTHNTRLHFHKPPTATEITDLELPSLHPLDIYFTVLTAVEQRIETL